MSDQEQHDEPQEQSQETSQEKPRTRLAWRLVKWTLVLAVLLFVLLTALSRMGGSSDVLRETVETFLSDNTPYSAHVTTLNNMHFFPNMIIDVEGLELRGGEAGEGEAEIRIGSARFVLSFIDMLFRPGKFKDIRITDLRATSGSLLSKPVEIASLSVVDENDQPHVAITGKIGQHEAEAKIGLAAKGPQGRRIYSIGAEKPFEIKIGDLTAEGTLRSTVTGTRKLENLAIGLGEQKALRGNLDFVHQDGGRQAIKGQLRAEPGKSELDPNLVVDLNNQPPSIFGVVRSGNIALEDFRKNAPLIKTLDALEEIFGDTNKKGIDINAFAADLNIEFKNISGDGIKWGDIKTPVKSAENALHIGPLKGRIIDGELSGDIHLTAENTTTNLESKIVIKDFDYAALQKQFMEKAEIDGKAHIILNLKSKGNTLSALIDGLSGKTSFVGGKAHMRVGLLNIWGGGLLNALLPSFGEQEELNVNCVVANMDIENLKGRSDAVFVDTTRITLHGEGTYDFKQDQLEMLLEPKAKDIALGNISSAVNVSGPLSDLKTSPNVFALGKKVGGLLLGTVNPAFFALSLADIGLNDNHPCKEFVIEKEVLPPPEPKQQPKPEPQAESAPTAPTPPAAETDGNQ